MGTGIWCLKISFPCKRYTVCKLFFFYSKENAEKHLRKEEFWFLSEHFQFIDKINPENNNKKINYTGHYEENFTYYFYNFNYLTNELSQDIFTNIDLYNGKFSKYYNTLNGNTFEEVPPFVSNIFEVTIELD